MFLAHKASGYTLDPDKIKKITIVKDSYDPALGFFSKYAKDILLQFPVFPTEDDEIDIPDGCSVLWHEVTHANQPDLFSLIQELDAFSRVIQMWSTIRKSYSVNAELQEVFPYEEYLESVHMSEEQILDEMLTKLAGPLTRTHLGVDHNLEQLRARHDDTLRIDRNTQLQKVS